MKKVVVVSNRVARVQPNEPISGGLAAALLPAVKKYGAIWVGASGKLRADHPGKDAFAEIEAFGKGALATIDMPEGHYSGYYEGFSNSALWPILHSRADLIRATARDYRSYREINAYMARALIRFCDPDVNFWVQDYHFLTLGHELRKLGVSQPLGFFLHTPWPARSMVLAMPNHREIVRAMLAYNLIGFQTREDQHNFADYVTNELGVHLLAPAGSCRLATFPIGIDIDEFAACAAKAAAAPAVVRLRSSLQGSRLAIGVDRVDYSKGLVNRVRALDHVWSERPSLKGGMSFLQIAVPSRGTIPSYGQLQNELTALVGEVNGRHGEVDWTPIRYINRGYSQAVLAGFYRTAHIGLVTPLHDGMNFVAKEYVAAQNPFDPGVLVLSSFAGAAKELSSAILVNPHDIDDIARSIAIAAEMPLDERLDRWNAMMATLRTSSVHTWFSGFLKALSGSAPRVAAMPEFAQRPQIEIAIP